MRYLPLLKLPSQSGAAKVRGAPRYLKTNSENVEVGKGVARTDEIRSS